MPARSSFRFHSGQSPFEALSGSAALLFVFSDPQRGPLDTHRRWRARLQQDSSTLASVQSSVNIETVHHRQSQSLNNLVARVDPHRVKRGSGCAPGPRQPLGGASVSRSGRPAGVGLVRSANASLPRADSAPACRHSSHSFRQAAMVARLRRATIDDLPVNHRP